MHIKCALGYVWQPILVLCVPFAYFKHPGIACVYPSYDLARVPPDSTRNSASTFRSWEEAFWSDPYLTLNQDVVLAIKYHRARIILGDPVENQNNFNFKLEFSCVQWYKSRLDHCAEVELWRSTPVGSIILPTDCSITVLQEQDAQGSVCVRYSYALRSWISHNLQYSWQNITLLVTLNSPSVICMYNKLSQLLVWKIEDSKLSNFFVNRTNKEWGLQGIKNNSWYHHSSMKSLQLITLTNCWLL